MPPLTSEAGELTAWMEVYTRALFTAAAGRQKIPTARPDPDVAGIDVLLQYPSASIGVQLKSTHSLTFNKKGLLRFGVKPGWVTNWHRAGIPPRLVLYVIDRDPLGWSKFVPGGEMHSALAYWAVLDRQVSAPSVTIDRTNRFTAETLEVWRREVEQGMGGQP